MNILQINTRYIGGGGASAIANLLHTSINNIDGMKSIFLYGRGSSNDLNSIKIAKEFECYISAASTRIIGRELNRGLSKDIKEEIDKADIVHIHNLHGYYIDYEELIEYIVKKRKKVVWTLHDIWSFTGRCAVSTKCNKWEHGCGNCDFLNMYPSTYHDVSSELWKKKKYIFTKLDKEKTIFITPSSWLKELMEKSFLSNYNIKVINNGVEKSNYINTEKNELRKKLGLPINKKIILFVAADPSNEIKGIKFILDILDKVDKDVVFVSLGKLINTESDNLIQLGYINDRNEIYKVYRSSDIFVIPSLADNFPTTVIEAFANGIPVVGFNTGGIQEQIINGVNGFLTDAKSSDELLDKINLVLTKLVNNEINENKILEEFKEKYTLEKFKANYIEQYRNL